MNHYPHHVGDYLKKTLGLSLAQDGAYRRAIDWYYDHEGPLPLKPAVYDELRCKGKPDRDAVDVVLAKYFTQTSEGYRHERCDEEIAKYADKSAKAAASADARWAKQAHSEGNANAMRTHSEGNASQKPVTISQGKEQRPARARGSRLPPDWELPDPWGKWAAEERGWSPAEIVRVAAEFADHWRGKGEVRADWEATWRNWVRRERARGGPVPAKQEARERFGSSIWETEDARHHDNELVIDGEAQRVA